MVANLQTGPKNFPAKKKAGTIGQPIVLENLKIVISMAGPWKKELGDGFTSFEARQNESAFPVIMKIRNIINRIEIIYPKSLLYFKRKKFNEEYGTKKHSLK